MHFVFDFGGVISRVYSGYKYDFLGKLWCVLGPLFLVSNLKPKFFEPR